MATIDAKKGTTARSMLKVLAYRALLLCFVAICVNRGLAYVLNVNMYCVSTGKFRTHEENIAAAIEHYISHQSDGGWDLDKVKYIAFKYSSAEELRRLNPGCCNGNSDGLPEAYFGDLVSRAVLGVSDVVAINDIKQGRLESGSVVWRSYNGALRKTGAIYVVDRCGGIREATYAGRIVTPR